MSRLAGLVVLLLVCVVGSLSLLSSPAFQVWSARALSRWATEGLGRPVTVARIQLDPQGVTLHGLRVPGLLQAPLVRVDWDLQEAARAWLRGASGTAALRRVVLVRPVLVLVRNTRGRWNAEQLFRRPPTAVEGPTEPLRGEVEIREGTLQLTDFARGQFRAVATRLEATLRLELPVVRGRIAGQIRPGSPGPIRVSGWVDVQQGIMDLQLDFRDLPVGPWGSYLFPSSRWRVESGTVAGRLRAYGNGASPSVRGELRFQDIAVHLPQQGLRVSEVAGRLELSGPQVDLNGVYFRLGAATGMVSGRVWLAGQGAVDLQVRFRGAELGQLYRIAGTANLPVAGRLSGNLRLQGPLGALRARSWLTGGRLMVGSQPVENASGTLHYAAGLVSVSSAAGSVRGGRVQLDAVAEVAAPFRVAATTYLEGVPTAAASALGLRLPLEGAVSGSLLMGGLPGQPQVAGVLSGGVSELFGHPLDSWRAVFQYQGATLHVLGARASRGTASVAGSGRLRPGSLELDFVATSVPLQDAARAAGVTSPTSGTVDLVGSLRGTSGAWWFSGTARSAAGSFADVRWDEATAKFAASSLALEVADLRWRSGSDTFRARGWVGFQGGSLQGELETSGIRLEHLGHLAGVSVPVSGELRARVKVKGSVGRPVVSGTVDLWDLRVPEAPIARAGAVFFWQDGTLSLEDAYVRSPALQAQLSGAISQAGEVQLRFSADPVRLQDIPQLENPFVRLEGTARLEGTVVGRLPQPVVDAQVSSTQVRVNGETFDTVQGQFRWVGRTLEVAPLVLRRRSSTYTVQGRLELSQDPTAVLLMDVQDARLATLLGMAGVAVEADGRVSGRLVVSGPLSSPRAELDATLTEGVFRRYRFPRATGRVVVEKGRVDLQQVELVSGRGRLVAQGTVNLQGSSDVEVAGLGLEAEALSSVLRLRTPLVGSLDFTVQLSGTLQDPTAGLALEGRGVGIPGAQVDRLTAQAIYRGGLLQLEQLLLEQQGHRVRARGRLPLRLRGLEPDPTGSVDFVASTDRADLSILRLVPFVENAQGPFEATVQVTGTVADPQLKGFLRAEGGRVQLVNLRPALEGVRLEVAFDRTAATLQSFRADLGSGSVEATGRASFDGLRLGGYTLDATARQAQVEIPPYFRGVVDGTVQLSGDARRARMKGRLTLSSGEFVVSSPTQGGPSPPALPLDLDLEMAAGEGLFVVAGPVRLQAGGALRVGGTLGGPALSGTITGRGGEYRAFGTTFVVEEGAAVFQEFRGTEPLLSARASTRVGDVTVFVHLAGTPGQMQVRLTSDPELPHERILQLLATQAGIQRALGGEVEGALRQQLASFLLGEFEQRIRQWLGLAELRIEYDFEKPLRLRLGRFLLRDLYLTLTTVFDSQTQFLWALEYRFARHYAVAFSYDAAGFWMALLRANFAW